MSKNLPRDWPLREALKTARAVIAGNTGILEGSIQLQSFAHDIVSDPHSDRDFSLFIAIASESDHLPFGEVRSRWSLEALALADVQIRRLTEAYQKSVFEACEHLLMRFHSAQTYP
jgi:hypothetical protein